MTAMLCDIIAEYRRQEASRGGFGVADQAECIAATARALGMAEPETRAKLADIWGARG